MVAVRLSLSTPCLGNGMLPLMEMVCYCLGNGMLPLMEMVCYRLWKWYVTAYGNGMLPLYAT
jgi:hypothetical protein